ncbi:Hsp70 family protein [uncultured Desulfuromonas sp.]|uniref:hsp70 family protein n=1 Tax=uncultured Desulfuromonas sp. TaxID=181013 RepID=UPI002AAB9B02|nr:Hsp70 family protein [uncultured Desulfuromonas sp.]
MTQPRYCIGIDLGTTNCVLSYVDRQQPQRGSQVLAINQWDSATTRIENPALPSFAYTPTTSERPQFSTTGDAVPEPISGWIAGIYARQQMAFSPGRVIHSAKSWLCHANIDRAAAILPWQSEEIAETDKCSPVQASALYLRWLKEIWQRRMADQEGSDFDAQDIVITVPASFDEVAQELTLKAAKHAGFPENLRLIEEPQAAFYFWLGRDKNLSELHDLLEQSQRSSLRILVCDIGGGTTDLSLFDVRTDKQARTGLALKRLAVSDHLLLGGDNIDLSLAHTLESRLVKPGKKLTGRQWNQLLAQARDLKERILGGEEQHSQVAADQTFTITLTGSGSGLFASTLSTRVKAEEIQRTILDGFFPQCPSHQRPECSQQMQKEWGLPYAEDSAISHHLAEFVDGQPVDAVLFNGGTVTPLLLRQRLHDLIRSWQPEQPPVVLHNESISMAVARGAARYGWILRQNEQESRIRGGHAHALYLEVVHGRKKKERSLVCILPKGLEAGQTVRIDATSFDLLVNQPARFQCWYASKRNQDRAGTVLDWNNREFHALPPLQTAIHLPPESPTPANNRLRVSLEASLNELGLLQLYCVEQQGDGRWRLDFNLRKGVDEQQESAPQTTEFSADPHCEQAVPYITAIFGKKKRADLPDIPAKQLIKSLEKQLGERDQWNSVTLRTLWIELAGGMTRKSRSLDHEVAWLYLAGFTLRPGYGVQHDESRMEELWRTWSLGMAFPKEKRSQSHWYLLWRRVTGGLNAARQQQVLDKILPVLRSSGDPMPEMVYLAAALERISPQIKVELIQRFSNCLLKEKIRHKAPYIWALSRLLSRTPLYAGADRIVHPREVMTLFDKVADKNWREEPWKGLSGLFAMAARCTDQRDIDLDNSERQLIVAKLRESKADKLAIDQVAHFVPLSDDDREVQFGEALPAGLILIGAP